MLAVYCDQNYIYAIGMYSYQDGKIIAVRNNFWFPAIKRPYSEFRPKLECSS